MDLTKSTHNYECKLGSTINLKVNTDSIWTFNGDIVTSSCDPNKGFQKENAVFSDTGRYECKVNSTVLHVFDVIIYDHYEYENGSTISLPIKERLDSSTWTFNGENVPSECNTQTEYGFEKKNASFSDSGRYECKADGKVKYAFDVVILGKFECRAGTTINLEDPVSPTWTFKGKNVAPAYEQQKRFEIKNTVFSDSGRYEYKVDGKVRNMFEVKVYDYLFGDTFLGIRTTVSGEALKKNSAFISKCAGIMKEDNQQGKMTMKEYNMTRNPRGIAVIVVIETFDFLPQLEGIKQDISNCEKTFASLHFEVHICKLQKAEDILQYITEIANKDHDKYDCFVLYFSSHGGDGFVCCSDFETKYLRDNKKERENRKGTGNGEDDYLERDDKKTSVMQRITIAKPQTVDKTAKGYILFDTLFELYLNKSCLTLQQKPKLFFFDCCRVPSEEIVTLPKPPIRTFDTYEERELYYTDICICYAAPPGREAFLGSIGSAYTEVLTKSLANLAPTESIADVMKAVDVAMKQKKGQQQFSTHRSYLERKLVLKKLDESTVSKEEKE